MLDRRRLLFTAAAGAGLAAAGQTLAQTPAVASARSPASAALHAAMDGIVQDQLLSSPEILTSLGMDKGPMAAMKARLNDRSLAKAEADKAQFRVRLAEIAAVDRAALTGADAVYYDSLKFYGDTVVRGYGFPYGGGGWPTPYTVNQMFGAYSSLPDFLDSQHAIDTEADAEAYLSRLAAVPTAFDQETERMQADFAAGAVPPDFIIERTLGQMDAILATPSGEQTLVRSIARRAAEKGIAGDWEARADRIVRDAVLPALARQAEALRARRAEAIHDAGVWRLADGDAYYDFSLAFFTTTRMTGQEIHDMGVAQMAELSARADELLKAQGLTQGTVGERIAALGREPRFVYPNTDAAKDELLAELNRQMAEMQARLPQYFGRIPASPVEVRRVPQATEAGAPGGYYQPPTLDGSRPGAYYINLRDTAEWPKWTLPTLTYHEATPGHHHQIALQMENADTPMLMKVLGFSAYTEGWGLYAEQLADEMGVYEDDPFGRIGYLQSMMFRAARLVVDSGLHFKRWSREQGVRYMVESLGDQESSVTTEVERYCVMPGQACSYKVGHTTWVRLREQARAALGDRFDIRGFHDAGLNAGGVPLEVLEGVIHDWTAARRG